MACDDCQDVINAALESVADLLDSGDDWNTGDEIAEFIRSRIGTNPLAERAAEYARGIEFRAGQLAEAQARIAELERERDRAIQQHERCAEKLFNAERQRDMLSEAAKAALHYMRLHKYADQAWADDLEAAIAAAMTPNV